MEIRRERRINRACESNERVDNENVTMPKKIGRQEERPTGYRELSEGIDTFRQTWTLRSRHDSSVTLRALQGLHGKRKPTLRGKMDQIETRACETSVKNCVEKTDGRRVQCTLPQWFYAQLQNGRLRREQKENRMFDTSMTLKIFREEFVKAKAEEKKVEGR